MRFNIARTEILSERDKRDHPQSERWPDEKGIMRARINFDLPVSPLVNEARIEMTFRADCDAGSTQLCAVRIP